MPLSKRDTVTSWHAGVWRSRGLRWGATVAAILGFSLIAMFGLMYWRSTVLLFDTLDRSVMEQLELLSARPPDLLPFLIKSRMNHQPTVITLAGLFDANGHPIVGDVTKIPDGIALTGHVQEVMAPGVPSEHWHAAGRRLADGRILIVARGADEILEVRADLIRGAAFGIIPAILLSLLGGAVVGVVTERRLRQINSVAESIIAGDLRERLPEKAGGDELDRLCAIVNRMLERLEEGVEALKGVGDNIAHDLRTPLTSVRARLERSQGLAGSDTLLGLSIGQSIHGVDQALSIVTALLRISDIRHVRRQSAFAAVDLAEILSETAESYRPVAEDKALTLVCSTTVQAVIIGDRQLLTEALVNLVDNAIKFTSAGGQVRIGLDGTPIHPIITVSDTGPGIPDEARSSVFTRFYRADTSRTTQGSGLGLSLVAEIMNLHGFAIELGENSPGCRIEIRCWRGSGQAPEQAAIGPAEPLRDQ